jgi:hypothetical protein
MSKFPEKRAIAAVKNAQGLDAEVKGFEASYERAGVKAYSKGVSWATKALAAHHSAAQALPSAHVKLESEIVIVWKYTAMTCPRPRSR